MFAGVRRARGGDFHTIPSILKLSGPKPACTSRFVFPYDSVYFKALTELPEELMNVLVFPYDSVYFKAILKRIAGDRVFLFPYDSVYFKASPGPPAGFRMYAKKRYFHTIPSILKRGRPLYGLSGLLYFHTIPSILKLVSALWE